MSDQETNQEVEQLCQRVQGLTQQVNEFTRKRKSKQRATAVLGVILISVVALSLGNVTRMSNKLDSDAIAQIGRQKVQERLPGARQKMQDYFEREAPRIVASTLHSMLGTLPHVRSMIFKGLNSKLDELDFQFEKNTTELMSNMVQESKKHIDKAYPDLSDREKLEKLVVDVTAKFHHTIGEATLALYPSYRDEMDRIAVHLEQIGSEDDTKLTDTEKTHKEIIVTLLQLLERRQAGSAAATTPATSSR